MPTTGTYLFDPDIAELFDEAFERAGIDPVAVGERHIRSAIRSLKYMLNSEWSTIGVRQWQVVEAVQSLTAGQITFTLPDGGLDILQATLRRGTTDTEMHPISRSDYRIIASKTQRGRPDRYFVDRQTGTRTVYIWQASENDTDQIVYDYFRQMQDAGELSHTLQMPSYAQDAAAEGLAMRLAQKFNGERYAALRISYGGPLYPTKLGGKLDLMRQEDRERGDVHLYPAYEPRLTRR